MNSQISMLRLVLLASACTFALCCLYPLRPLGNAHAPPLPPPPPSLMEDRLTPPADIAMALPMYFQCTWDEESPPWYSRKVPLQTKNSSSKACALRKTVVD
jgi:hypothetical protein